MKNLNLTGSILAVAAATLITTGCTNTMSSSEPASAASTAKVHCNGVNECKGQGACATANNACGGQNACKGQGFIELTAEECEAKGGTVG